MATLLLELFSEEIPSRMQRSGAEQLQRLITEGFKKSGLDVDAKTIKTFVSPRHLAIQITSLPTIQPDVKEERRGPKIGAPEQALKGFLQSTGLTLEQCETRDGYYYATIEKKGRAVTEVAKEIGESALSAFVWPKSMKWGARGLQWVRPLHKITCLLDETIIPVQFGHLTASNITHGHRFLAPGEVTIPHAEKYESLLAAANVIVDFAARRTKIAAEIAAVASAAKLTLHNDESLLDEVTGLVEHPVPLLCEFDAKFLDLPPEVLISEMKNHQRYFALYGADGKLTNRFITVANMVNADGGARVREGNGRVVRARLADGEFYWEQDRKVKLEDWSKKLSDVVFHAKVGMMDKKVERIEALAVDIAKAANYTDEKQVRQAARLCKADLTSGMVGEFPELQGIMGRYYALEQGESQEIADAIRDHYKPLGANDMPTKSKLASIIGIADRLDSIISLFNAGEKPTGSKDPLALRRAGNGIMQIVYMHDFALDLVPLVSSAKNPTEILSFLQDRLRNELSLIIHPEIVDAVLSLPSKGFTPDVLKAKVHTVNNLSHEAEGKALIAAIRRALNILAAEEKKSKETFSFDANANLYKEPSEKTLHKAINDGLATIGNFKPAKDASPMLSPIINIEQKLLTLVAPINQFFTDLMVNAEDTAVRTARLRLLAGVRELSRHLADFTKIPDLSSEATNG